MSRDDEMETCSKCGAESPTYAVRLGYEERILAAEMDAIEARRALGNARELARADKDRRIEIALKMLVARFPVAADLTVQAQTAIVNAMEDFAQALTSPRPSGEMVERVADATVNSIMADFQQRGGLAAIGDEMANATSYIRSTIWLRVREALAALSTGSNSPSLGVEETAEPETGWLIERGPQSAPLYLTVENEMFAWTADNLAAIRLARREDADRLAEICIDDVSRVAEHRWG